MKFSDQFPNQDRLRGELEAEVVLISESHMFVGSKEVS